MRKPIRFKQQDTQQLLRSQLTRIANELHDLEQGVRRRAGDTPTDREVVLVQDLVRARAAILDARGVRR
jgi:hypothetical protein